MMKTPGRSLCLCVYRRGDCFATESTCAERKSWLKKWFFLGLVLQRFSKDQSLTHVQYNLQSWFLTEESSYLLSSLSTCYILLQTENSSEASESPLSHSNERLRRPNRLTLSIRFWMQPAPVEQPASSVFMALTLFLLFLLSVRVFTLSTSVMPGLNRLVSPVVRRLSCITTAN